MKDLTCFQFTSSPRRLLIHSKDTLYCSYKTNAHHLKNTMVCAMYRMHNAPASAGMHYSMQFVLRARAVQLIQIDLTGAVYNHFIRPAICIDPMDGSHAK